MCHASTLTLVRFSSSIKAFRNSNLNIQTQKVSVIPTWFSESMRTRLFQVCAGTFPFCQHSGWKSVGLLQPSPQSSKLPLALSMAHLGRVCQACYSLPLLLWQNLHPFGPGFAFWSRFLYDSVQTDDDSGRRRMLCGLGKTLSNKTNVHYLVGDQNVWNTKITLDLQKSWVKNAAFFSVDPGAGCWFHLEKASGLILCICFKMQRITPSVT